jgi:aminopeptidase N
MSKRTAADTIYRKDYRPYPWKLERAELFFAIGDPETRVTAILDFESRDASGPPGSIVLDGCNLELLSISLNGEPLGEDRYRVEGEQLTIDTDEQRVRLETEVAIRPWENTALEGLYGSGAFLLTQCEPEGFRKITWFPDRPDVMTVYEVTIEADRERYPVLLSNGNAVASGAGEDGRHWVRWADPFPKPCYLFALVAGDLACVQDRFVTRSGREVTIRFYVEAENAGRCDHAVESLIKAMKWDEERFGLEYDLDIYHVVATNDFNMGAMENKSLNIFNSLYVLASPETATDANYQGIESVIGHEYFHNWTGNRVTCQDWFQLTLKEGLTVFRDQEFTSDLQSRAVKRIQDVRLLRSHQFNEDAGPMAHPVRPDKYKEINNFYTMTVYRKGAEVIRMYHTLLGEEGFQRGLRLYFQRHDGQAVTCDDFLSAMADANEMDLTALGRWYGQSGTPVVRASGSYEADKRAYTLKLAQHTPATPDQAEKAPVLIPFKVGLLGRDGRELPLKLARGGRLADGSALLLLDEVEREFRFEDVPEPPVPSLLRDFSAPVRLEHDCSDEELALLMAHDSNAFVRWEAAQLLAQRTILANVERRAGGEEMRIEPALLDAFAALFADRFADPALVAETVMLPDETWLAGLLDEVDVDGIHAARDFVRHALAVNLEAVLLQRYEELAARGPYDKSASAIANRSLRNACLAYLMETSGGGALARRQLADSDNMTDTLAALRALAWKEDPSAGAALDEFADRWQDDALVMDKWFNIQASVPGAATVARVRDLLEQPAFSLKNPNKVRALLGVFSVANPTAFHAGDGAGYRLLADRIMDLDALNPQVAARLAAAFNSWLRYDGMRKALMRKELERIASRRGLSGDVAEIVGSALAMEEARATP